MYESVVNTKPPTAGALFDGTDQSFVSGENVHRKRFFPAKDNVQFSTKDRSYRLGKEEQIRGILLS